MHSKGIDLFIRQGLIPAIVLVALAGAVRLWPLQDLGAGLTYVTFYPAVIFAALYGGLPAGLSAALFSCVVIVFAGPAIFGAAVVKDFGQWLGIAVFGLNCTMISGITEALRRSRSRASQALRDLERKNTELHAARDSLEDEVKLRTAELVEANVALEKELTERKQADKELKESEAGLKRSQAMAHLGSWELDVVNDVLTWSDEVYRIFGLRPQEFKATYGAFLDAVHPEDRKAVDEAYSGSLRDGNDTYEIVHRIVRKSGGEVRVVHEKCQHIRDQSGRVTRSLGMVHDITERRRDEHERELTVEFLHLVNESRGTEDLMAAAAGFFHRRSGCEAAGIRLKDGNDYPYFEVRGLPQEFVRLENCLCTHENNGLVCQDSTGIPVLACMCGHIVQGRFDPSKSFFTDQGSFWTNSTSELLAKAPEEDRRYFTRNRCNGEGYESVALIPLRAGDESWGLIQLNDKRKGRFTPEIIAAWERLARHMSEALAKFKAEEALREAKGSLEVRVKERTADLEAAKEAVTAERHRLYDVLETLPLYICLLDSDYRMPFANRYFRETFGESQGRRCHEFLFDLAEPCEICETYSVLKTRAPHHWYWTGPNGRDYDIYDFPFTDSDGSFLILEMGIDITERNRAEEALRETLADLTRSNSDLEQFAYVASHDLQEPLRSVTIALQMLEKSHKGKLSSDADQLIQYAVDGAQRMKNLIADLLQYSRLATRGQPFEMVNVQHVVNRSIQNLESLIERKGTVITCDPMPTVKGDATQFLQLFQNLMGNAVKFGPAESPKVHVSSRKTDSEWVFSVRDNGIGIEKRHFERIFVIFQQLNKRGSYGGTGMGLAIVKKIVERHRGRVWVESEVGVGSTFYFTIPEASME